MRLLSNIVPAFVNGCLRCLLLVMCTHPFAKKGLTLYLARSEGRELYFGCNLMHRKVLASFHQHLMAEAHQVHRFRVFPAKRLTLYREPTSLVVCETKLPPAKPSFEDFVLLEQVDNSGLLVTLEPTSDGDDQQGQGLDRRAHDRGF